MADNVSKYGLRFYRSLHGSGVPTPEERFLASAYQAAPGGTSVDINIGDPMQLVSDGSLAIATAGGGTSHIVVGIKQYWDGTFLRSGKKVPGASGAYSTNLSRQTIVYALRAESAIWEVDASDNTTATTLAAYQALIGENADLVYSASASTGLANPRLSMSTHAVTATLQCRIQGISDTIENKDFSGSYVKLLVTFNMPQSAGAAATPIVGV